MIVLQDSSKREQHKAFFEGAVSSVEQSTLGYVVCDVAACQSHVIQHLRPTL